MLWFSKSSKIGKLELILAIGAKIYLITQGNDRQAFFVSFQTTFFIRPRYIWAETGYIFWPKKDTFGPH